jgi:hypothetical protein
MKGSSLIVIVIVLAFIVGIFVLLQKQFEGPKNICPDEWIVNRMPTTDQNKKAEEYLIVDGKRADIKDYNTEWIKQHCTVTQPKAVY